MAQDSKKIFKSFQKWDHLVVNQMADTMKDYFLITQISQGIFTIQLNIL